MTGNYKEDSIVSGKGEAFRLKIKGLDFAFEKRLYMKLHTMCERITKERPKLDACIVNEGYEGEGKTNASLVEAIISQWLINKGSRKKTSIHLFFKTSSCIKFAQSTEQKIIILDEPSLESLSVDHAASLNKNFLRLTSTMRKKRHLLIINFAKFWKFPEFLVVDRALGMVCLSSKQGKDPGRFIYIKKRNLEKLWNGKKKSNKRLHKKLRSFGGRFPYLMEDIFNEFNIQVEGMMNATMEDYDEEKDKAIQSIGVGKEKKDRYEIKLIALRKKISVIWKHRSITQQELAASLQINPKRLRDWAVLPPLGGD